MIWVLVASGRTESLTVGRKLCGVQRLFFNPSSKDMNAVVPGSLIYVQNPYQHQQYFLTNSQPVLSHGAFGIQSFSHIELLPRQAAQTHSCSTYSVPFNQRTCTPPISSLLAAPLAYAATYRHFHSDQNREFSTSVLSLLKGIKESGQVKEGSEVRGIISLESQGNSRKAASSENQRLTGSVQKSPNLVTRKQHRKDWQAKAGSKRNMLAPKWQEIKAPSRGEYDQISDAISSYYERNKQTKELYLKKMQLRDALHEILKDVFPNCGLYVGGSSVNGFGNNKSDMDLCLMVSQSEITRGQSAAVLKALQKALYECRFITHLQFINAKVPILKFTDRDRGIHCDLNLNNEVGVRNTHLLNAYAKADPRLSPLVLFAKRWANHQNINSARDCTLSSYSVVLMVIHYLQVVASPPVLPCIQRLHPEKFNAACDIRELTLRNNKPDFTSTNEQSLGDLFAGFLHYYAHVFNFDEKIISVRLGCAIQRHSSVQSQWKFICIEEPFNLTNTARSVYILNEFMRIKHVFRKSYTELSKTKSMESILTKTF